MEQNTPKFRLRLNLFDGIVLVVALVAAAVMAAMMLTPDTVTSPDTQMKTATYTIRLKYATPQLADVIQVGDSLEDAVKNLDLGTVVSFSSHPATNRVLDESSLTYILQPNPEQINVDIVVTAPASMTEDQILLSSGYRIRGGETTYVRGPGYLGSGIILDIDRGIAE